MSLPVVVNIKVAELRKRGYENFEEWSKVPGNVYIGRFMVYIKGTYKSVWANPFPVKTYGREEALRLYKEYILSSPELLKRLPELRGAKELGCWCAPTPCHGDILIGLLPESGYTPES